MAIADYCSLFGVVNLVEWITVIGSGNCQRLMKPFSLGMARYPIIRQEYSFKECVEGKFEKLGSTSACNINVVEGKG